MKKENERHRIRQGLLETQLITGDQVFVGLGASLMTHVTPSILYDQFIGASKRVTRSNFNKDTSLRHTKYPPYVRSVKINERHLFSQG